MAKRDHTDAPWGMPVSVEEINAKCGIVGLVSVAPDGLTIWWGVSGEIWFATRARRGEPFGAIQSLGGPVNTGFYEGHPKISHDWPNRGAVLLFVRVSKGPRTTDVYQATWNPSPAELSLDANESAAKDRQLDR